ncbi:MAG: hypothetical protein PHY73_06540 [Candidatus Omnitrophica bacterium]|nr:hypothetical protein [Candidatus Omnitrophota bacterium]
MVKKVIVLLFGIIAVLGLCLTSSAQETAETEFVLGAVSEVSDLSITIIDLDDEEAEMMFMINGDTIFENFESTDEIEVGENVYVDYVFENEENVAVSIFKINIEDNEEENAEDLFVPEEDADG